LSIWSAIDRYTCCHQCAGPRAGRSLREHLAPRQEPALGEYNDRDPAVISQHLGWSRDAGIDFWAASWWGPGSGEDVTLLDHILTQPVAPAPATAREDSPSGTDYPAPTSDRIVGDVSAVPMRDTRSLSRR
jgi:hypothetical protein